MSVTTDNPQMFTSDSVEYCTPREVWERVCRLGPIDLDPCGHVGSTVPARTVFIHDKAQWVVAGLRGYHKISWRNEFLREPVPGFTRTLPGFSGAQKLLFLDGLAQPYWHGLTYMNPPYGDVIEDWVKHASQQSLVVGLLPARVDTGWFHEYVYARAAAICFWKGRVWFQGMESGAPFPSAVVLWLNGEQALLGSPLEARKKFRSAFADAGHIEMIR